MNRVLLGILCGILFGAMDPSMVLFGKSPEKSKTLLLQAFFSRFVLGILAANVTISAAPAVSGAIVGFLISLPEAIAMKSVRGNPRHGPRVWSVDRIGGKTLGDIVGTQ